MKFVTEKKGRPDRALVQKECPKELTELMEITWDQDPARRPSFMQILYFFKGLFDKNKKPK